MSYQTASLLLFLAVLLARSSFSAQRNGNSSPCMVEYEDHSQIEYGPLVVQEIRGTITDPQPVAVPKACVGVFTNKEHKLLATTESDQDGKFSLQTLPPGRYRLVVKADPLCAANAPIVVLKHQRKKKILRVHMLARGIDSCRYAETVNARKADARFPLSN